MGSEASKSTNKLKSLVPEPFNEELASLRWKTASAEAKCLEMEKEVSRMKVELQRYQDENRSLKEQLYYPVQYNIGRLYVQGTKDAIEQLHALASGEHGVPEPLAHGYLAVLYKKSNQDLSLILYHAQACMEYINQGVGVSNPHCQYIKGNFYYYGIIKRSDVRKAMALWLQAADQGHIMAQFALGSKYFIGITGVIENKAEAFRWFLMAANQGYAMAQFWVGNCYENGYGCVRSLDEAGRYYDLASSQGVTTLGPS